MNYYISDIHFGDKRIFELCNRTKSIMEFEKSFITRWNMKIKAEDDVYILGDISYDGYKKIIDIFKKLNGRKHILIGNHDEWILNNPNIHSDLCRLATIDFILIIKDKNREVFLCHYPVMDWPNIENGSIHLYGHIHNKDKSEIKEYFKNKMAFNVSSDVVNHEPRTIDELIILKEDNKNETLVN